MLVIKDTLDYCNNCIHSDVCAYKEHYVEAVKLYEKVRAECTKYPWFKCKIECCKHASIGIKEIDL